MPVVAAGPLAGHRIRTARVAHKCTNFRAHERGLVPTCLVDIKPGDRYVEDECDPYEAGGFAMTKLCLPCADLPGDSS